MNRQVLTPEEIERAAAIRARLQAADLGLKVQVEVAQKAQWDAMKAAGIDPADSIAQRKFDVPAGLKKVYAGHVSHQGKREMQRRRRRMERK